MNFETYPSAIREVGNMRCKIFPYALKPASSYAVVGMNGSGKSTFIKLLCRLYEPTEGEIFLNGKNIREY